MMFSQMARLSAAVAVSLLVGAGSAGATTISVGGGPYALLTDNYTALVNESGGVPINDMYDFKVVSPVGTVTTSVSLNTFPICPGAGCFGIADLTVKWLDAGLNVLDTLVVTNGGGTYLNPAPMLLNLATNGIYHLLVIGTALTKGGTYNVNVAVTADERQSPVPLPPALILFGSALVGMTVLGRRKKQGAAV